MNGLGNLVLGYNAEPPFPISRAGSHCLVLGAYSSYAGIAAGFDNHTTAPYASALVAGAIGRPGPSARSWAGRSITPRTGTLRRFVGGNANRATNIDPVVCGGNLNHASARFSVVGGGTNTGQATEFGWSAGSFGAATAGRFTSP